MQAVKEFEEFHKEWEPKMMSMASKTYIMDDAVDREDVFQELSYTLWKCFNSYDPDAGVQFNTYFYTSAKNQVYMMLAYAGAKKRSGVKVNLDFYKGCYYDNKINEASFKMALFQRIKDRQVQAAIEYILEGGDTQDLPMDVIKKLKKAVSRQLRNHNF
jgi:RNA polymerase sigma factor (sigma-70 family)